ncbi:lytic transglycosylase domain-containing protein [Achromobacter insolitus]|uniref:lytic transglycosylase domain-containing protein n=1 Tax=Achromobacter insolitus TaxID=217204 RepID=UPI001EEE3B89|nr:lytic transglycosylase domain-containing protein [Achromobacter insolitus]
MRGVNIKIGAQFDAADVERSVQKFAQQFNKLGAAIAQVNRLKYQPIDKATLENMRQFQAQFESLKRISGGFNQRLKATGQGGSGFFDIDWARMYENPAERARRMQRAFEYVSSGVGGGFSSIPAPVPPAPGGGGGTRPAGPGGGAGWGTAGRRIVSSGLRSAGAVGGVADNSLSVGMAGGATAGLAGLLGGIVALGVGKAIGAVMGKVNDAQREFIQYDTLKRTLGDVNVSFGVLKESLRAASKSIDVTFEEGQKLGTEFANISGMAPDQYKTLAEEVRIGGGFGRSFGLEPGADNSFFAQMRQFQVTGNEQDSRRLALMIGESIGKSGAFSKADEVLQAIASYTTQQTRLGMVTGNVGGYAGMLSGLVGSRTPGLDVGGSANLLSRVNSAIAGGGSAGEAGQNFIYSAIGRRLGLDPIQSQILQEQGAFGTGSATFGSGSLYARYAKRFGMSSPGGTAGSSATTLQMLMEHFRKVYADRPELMANAMSNFFGISTNQAMALALTSPSDLGGIAKTLEGSGFDMRNLSATGIEALGRIQSGGRDVLDAQAQSLRSRTGIDALNAEEEKRLRIAQASGNDDDLRAELIKLTASREQEKTDGSETRKATVGMLNLQQELAGKLVPLFTDMRAGILYLAGDKGEKGPLAIKQAIMSSESRERQTAIGAQYDARISDARKAVVDATNNYNTAKEEARQTMPGMTPEQQAEVRKKLDQLRQEQVRAEENVRKMADEKVAALGAEESKLKSDIKAMRQGVMMPGANGADGSAMSSSDVLFNALIKTESGGRHLGPDGKLLRSNVGALGVTQIMPGTGNDPGYGVTPLQNDSEAEYRRFGRDYLDAMLKKYGGDQSKALAAYNAGPGTVDAAVKNYGDDWLNKMPSETRNYVSRISGNMGQYKTALPDGTKPTATQTDSTQRVAIEGTFTLNKPDGTPAAAPVQINKRVGAPSAFGAAR